MAVKRHIFSRLDANYVPLVLLKADGVPLVHQPIHTAPPPTAPTGGYQHPLLISSSCGGTSEGDFEKRLALGKEKAATGTALFL